MESVRTLIVGAGVTGLATAAFLKDQDYLILEADQEPGGYCKTITKDGFVWDYSGHFFHFKHPDLEAWLKQRMPGQRVLTVQKKSFIAFKDRWVDFPFQKNIHQLPQEDFIECLHDLYMAQQGGAGASYQNFKDMLMGRLGRAVCEKFLFPYNEKLYATDLATLDQDAMGRFFPHVELRDVIANMRTPDNQSYNSTFTYPEGGAIQYVHALLSAVRPGALSLSQPVVKIDLKDRVAHTAARSIRYERLVSSAPLPALLSMCGLHEPPGTFTWNKVMVFNLGFSAKGPRNVHWLYVPDRARSFYRVGFYDNIFDGPRMSLYVELGYPRDAATHPEAMLPRVLEDLSAQGILTTQRLVAHHSVVMDPAYVHITRASLDAVARNTAALNAHGVYSVGRYGRWTYCSIEDNMVEARALARAFSTEG